MNIAKVTWLFWFPWLPYCHGKATEDPRSACDSGPCQNGAQCIDITYPGGPLAFKCACKEGYEGFTCQKRIDLCADDPCQNGGVCSQRGEHYHCACPEGFHGKNCESPAAKKDPCSEKPCGPHGVCEVINGQVSCECLQGYSGPKCETSEKKEEVVAVPTNQNEEEAWVIKDILIAMLFFVVLFAAIMFFVCCHCYRVWNQRSALRAVQEARTAAGKDPGPVIGWVDLSNQMCYDFFCCCFPRPEKSPLLGDRCFADPDNITGVIVPLKDYNTWIRCGYMPVGFGNGAGKVKIDNIVPEVDRAAMRGQPVEIEYNCEPVKYKTAREEVKIPASCPYERPGPMMQKAKQDFMEPAPEQPCDMTDMFSDRQRNMTHQQVQTNMGRMSGVMTPETNAVQRPSYYSNMNVNQEPPYYDYRTPPMSQRTSVNPFSADRKKMSRSNLYAHYGKNFTQSNLWSQPNMMDMAQDANHTFSQSTNQNHAQPDPNLDTYPVAMYNGMPPEPPRPDFYSNGLYPVPPAPPYPWIPQPYTYPYAFPYPPQNNNQDNSSSEVCSAQVAPRKKVQTRKTSDRNISPHSTAQQKPSHGGIKGHAMNRRQSAGNVQGGESKMDHLQFTDDDAGESEATLIDISEDGGRYHDVDTDTDEETLDRIDDDGYGSTNRLSESEAGGRMRPFQGHHDYSGDSSRHYIPRKHKQRIQKLNKLSPRSPQQYSTHSSKLRRSNINERSPQSCKIPLCNSEQADYHGSEDSTSEDEQEDNLGFNGHSAIQNNGNRTRHDTYRVQQPIQDNGHAPHKLMRRGDLWSGQISKCLTSQKCLPKGEDVHILKPVPKTERQCLTIAPKKVKGILKNNSHGGNYNRSASSFSLRKIKDVTTGRFNSRRRSLKQVENDETE